MRRIIVLASGLFMVAGATTVAKPAVASFQVCNDTDAPIDVAMGYQSGSSKGWWHIEEGKCIRTVDGALQDRFYYVYADSLSLGITWEGNNQFCVNRNAPFNFQGLRCRSEDRHGFEEIDTANRSRWTHVIREGAESTDQGRRGGPTEASAGAADLRVTSEGTIEKLLPDGRVELFNPATGKRGFRNVDGSVDWMILIDTQVDNLPDLPPTFNEWESRVSENLSQLVSNLLSPPEVTTLESKAPPDFLPNVAYQLKILSYITK